MHVQVAVGILVVQHGLVLMGKRTAGLGAGTWCTPGGCLAFGDEIVDCAARVLQQQTRLTARSLELGPYSNDVLAETRQHLLSICVVARSIVGTPVNQNPDSCEGWAWFKWGEWPSPLFTPAQSLLAIGWRPGGT